MAAGRSMVIIAHLRHGVQTHSVHDPWGKIIAHYLVPIVWKERRGWVEGIYYFKIGIMTFKELFSQFSFAEIRPAFPEFMADQRTETGRTSRFGQMGKILSERPSVGRRIIPILHSLRISLGNL